MMNKVTFYSKVPNKFYNKKILEYSPLIWDSKDGKPEEASLKDAEVLLLLFLLDSLDDTLLLLHCVVEVVSGIFASFHASSMDSGVNCIGVLFTSGSLSLINVLSSILFPRNSWSWGEIVNLDAAADVLRRLGEGR